jgi:hypothetical protein
VLRCALKASTNWRNGQLLLHNHFDFCSDRVTFEAAIDKEGDSSSKVKLKSACLQREERQDDERATKSKKERKRPANVHKQRSPKGESKATKDERQRLMGSSQLEMVEVVEALAKSDHGL